MDAPTDRRLAFITQKYKEGKFRKTTLLYKTKEELNKVKPAEVICVTSFRNCFCEVEKCKALHVQGICSMMPVLD